MSDVGNGHPRDLLSEYLDDELDVTARGSIDRHLASCEDCRIQLDALRRLSRAIADEVVPAVPVDLFARIGRRVDGKAAARPGKASRFAIPATIAATLGTIGLLVALQWREGHFVAPSVVEDKASKDELAASAPDKRKASLPATPEVEEAARGDSLKKELDRPEPAAVVGKVAENEPRERAARENMNDVAGQAAGAPALKSAVASAPAAKLESHSVCEEQWSDSGVSGAWQVEDAAAASGSLDRIARDVAGIGVWRGIADGRPYVLIVPRARFEEVFYALRARGISGLTDPPVLPEGSGCAGISIAIKVGAP